MVLRAVIEPGFSFISVDLATWYRELFRESMENLNIHQ